MLYNKKIREHLTSCHIQFQFFLFYNKKLGVRCTKDWYMLGVLPNLI